MFAIMGITGRVGGSAARLLGKESVRAVVRAPSASWRECAIADVLDTEALTRAFRGAEGVFVMTPPNWSPSPGFPEAQATARSIAAALRDARPGKVVSLSSIGAQHAHGLGLIHASHLFERALDQLSLPLAHVRAGWFMENAAADVEAAKQGSIDSYLAPLERTIPMVATADVGACVAQLLREDWQGRRVIELGTATSPAMIADGFAKALGHPVAMRVAPRASWNFEAARCEMLDGFNSGWIAFQGEPRRAQTTFEEVARELVEARE